LALIGGGAATDEASKRHAVPRCQGSGSEVLADSRNLKTGNLAVDPRIWTARYWTKVQWRRHGTVC
jgi:hypothetical protein